MPITNIVSHIPGITNSALVTTGSATPAPYTSVSITGATDGTNIATASKNMAVIYNRQLFAEQYLIELAGLAFNANNWGQQAQAIQKIALSSNYVKALAQFNGVTSATILNSANILSIVRVGAGTYNVQFITSMANNNYSIVYGSGSGPAGIGMRTISQAAIGFSCVSIDANGFTAVDHPNVSFVVARS